jgi:hypothetical protein
VTGSKGSNPVSNKWHVQQQHFLNSSLLRFCQYAHLQFLYFFPFLDPICMTDTGPFCMPLPFFVNKYSNIPQDSVVFCCVVTLFSAKRTLHIPFLSSIIVVLCVYCRFCAGPFFYDAGAGWSTSFFTLSVSHAITHSPTHTHTGVYIHIRLYRFYTNLRSASPIWN